MQKSRNSHAADIKRKAKLKAKIEKRKKAQL